MSIAWGASAKDGTIAAVIAASGTSVTAVIDNNAKTATEISVKVTYNGASTAGASVQILRPVDSTPNFQVTADNPASHLVTFAAGASVKDVFTLDAYFSQFKIQVTNLDAVRTITGVEVWVRQGV